ncbi:hypothetical protein [Streptomyces radicis]|uniref:hypothetical protein n=1 Tax=Streptomyces radicis TaxID=1750517 RepID=UPI0016008AD7|nr:hypothetical protein [Streptomyces radicis]
MSAAASPPPVEDPVGDRVADGPPAPDRRLLLLGSLASALVVLLLSTFIASHLTRTTETRSTTHPGAFDRVAVTVSGDATVRGTDAEAVEAEWSLSWSLFRPEVSARRDGDTLRLSLSCPGLPGQDCDASVALRVPATAAVDITAPGTIDVAGITGGVRASGQAGPIRLADVAGPLELRGRDGTITGDRLGGGPAEVRTRDGAIALRFAEPPDALAVDTRDGSVELALPEVAQGYAVETTGRGGEAEVSFPSSPDSGRSVRVGTRDGAVAVGLTG